MAGGRPLYREAWLGKRTRVLHVIRRALSMLDIPARLSAIRQSDVNHDEMSQLASTEKFHWRNRVVITLERLDF
jgi:hypothetical protein